MKVLIVDDELNVRDLLSKALSGDGHEVCSVESGRAAIDFAIRMQPEVLVADWILPGDMNGLQVARALAAVDPDLRTVLISGYPSKDLGDDAALAGIDSFLVKPLELTELIDAVRALEKGSARKTQSTFAVVATDDAENVVTFNIAAKKMFAAARCPQNPNHVEELFGEDYLKLKQSRDEWVQIGVAGGDEQWSVRSREWESGRLHVFLRENQNHLRADVIVRLLLSLRKTAELRWPHKNNVLIVDDSPAVRGALCTQLERIGCTGYKADSHDLAVKLVGADSGIGVAVVDYEMPGVNTANLLEDLMARRPGIKIVGSSGRDHRADFERLGVSRYLAKPWTVADLIDIVGE
jgi:DNA-binding NtrC family response regulator